jgi:hypothetical protein
VLPAQPALLVQQALMEPKVLQDLPVLPDLKDRLVLQVWQEQMERQALRVQLAPRVLKGMLEQ